MSAIKWLAVEFIKDWFRAPISGTFVLMVAGAALAAGASGNGDRSLLLIILSQGILANRPKPDGV